MRKVFFVLTLLGILLLIVISQHPRERTATIESISTSQSKTTIKLQNQEAELIIFEPLSLNITKGDQINFIGKNEIYKNKEQIIVSKIKTLS